jgi:hypothetical protein
MREVKHLRSKYKAPKWTNCNKALEVRGLLTVCLDRIVQLYGYLPGMRKPFLLNKHP